MQSLVKYSMAAVAMAGCLMLIAGATSAGAPDAAGAASGGSKLVFVGAGGRLQYAPNEKDDTIPDFSNCGYMGGGVAIPEAMVKVTLSPVAGAAKDDGARIQQAIDAVSKMPLDKRGIRGAVLLKRGTYRIADQLKIGASGIVLRGEGDGDDGTIIIATGKKKRDLISVAGGVGAEEKDTDEPGETFNPDQQDRARRAVVREIASTRRKITDDYVPVGARTFTVQSPSSFKVGDTVTVRRAGNKEWISTIGMDHITPRPGHESSTKQWQPFELPFDRVVIAVEGAKITVDAPIVCAIDQKWGGGTIAKYSDEGRIQNVGVERIRGVSEFDKSKTEKHDNETYPADEDHAMYLVSFDHMKNGWVRNVTTMYFYHGPTAIRGGAKWVTVQDSTSLEPVSQITGGRRYPFLIMGQQNLVQRCKSDKGRHAFVFGSRVCGPNVFLDCASTHDYATSEPHHRWSVGGLYDNVHAHMAFQDRQYLGSGHGWAGANYVAWNCEGRLVCQSPPTAQNWSIGFVGQKEKGAFEPRPDGIWESLGKHVEPRSLYLKQLEDRLGPQSVQAMSRAAAK